jgi:hypothetical protein
MKIARDNSHSSGVAKVMQDRKGAATLRIDLLWTRIHSSRRRTVQESQSELERTLNIQGRAAELEYERSLSLLPPSILVISP